MSVTIEDLQCPVASAATFAVDGCLQDYVQLLPQGQFLSFRVGNEEYGIDILRVREIRSYEAPTRIANAPPFVKGVINLRGAIVPIVDLRPWLGCETVLYNELTVVIVLNVRHRVVGAVVDSVSDVIALDADSIRPAPQLRTNINEGFILGIGCIGASNPERMLILSDIDILMSNAGIGVADLLTS